MARRNRVVNIVHFAGEAKDRSFLLLARNSFQKS
jgi:hypothetical protein